MTQDFDKADRLAQRLLKYVETNSIPLLSIKKMITDLARAYLALRNSHAALAFGSASDAYHNLSGAVIDIEATGVCDAVSLKTLKRVEKQLSNARLENSQADNQTHAVVNSSPVSLPPVSHDWRGLATPGCKKYPYADDTCQWPECKCHRLGDPTPQQRESSPIAELQSRFGPDKIRAAVEYLAMMAWDDPGEPPASLGEEMLIELFRILGPPVTKEQREAWLDERLDLLKDFYVGLY